MTRGSQNWDKDVGTLLSFDILAYVCFCNCCIGLSCSPHDTSSWFTFLFSKYRRHFGTVTDNFLMLDYYLKDFHLFSVKKIAVVQHVQPV